MRKKRRDFVKEAKRAPYELDLEGEVEGRPNFVTFKDPNKLPTENALTLSKQQDVQKILQALLGEDYEAFWAEWRDAPIDETNELIADVMDHYGANLGN